MSPTDCHRQPILVAILSDGINDHNVNTISSSSLPEARNVRIQDSVRLGIGLAQSAWDMLKTGRSTEVEPTIEFVSSWDDHAIGGIVPTDDDSHFILHAICVMNANDKNFQRSVGLDTMTSLIRHYKNQLVFVGMEPVVLGTSTSTQHSDSFDHHLPRHVVEQQCGKVQRLCDDVTNLQSQDHNGATQTLCRGCISWDLPLHLAALQANCLPKSPHFHGDAFHTMSMTMDSNEFGISSILCDYEYDYNNPFGGSDPLLCPTREVNVAQPYLPSSPILATANSSNRDPTVWKQMMQHSSAAAFTWLRGNGMDPTLAACIASSVGRAALEASDGIPRDYALQVEQVAQLSQQARASLVHEPVLRKLYREFGYS